MKKVYNLLLIIALPSILVLYSYNSGSPGGKSGSPGDGGSTCTECHSGTSQSQSGWITTNIPTEGFTAGETYTITATGTHSGVVKFGFELTAEDAFGSKIGVFTISEPGRTKLTNANHAVTQTAGGTSVSGNSNTWSMDWTAPASSPSVVKFYAAFNAANGNGMTSGDIIYTSFSSYNLYIAPVPQLTGVDPNTEQQGYEGELVITGNDTEWTSGVSNVSFKFHDDNNISFDASEISITTDEMLTIGVLIPEDMEIGVYDVHVDELVLENGFTVDIYDGIKDNYLTEAVSVYPNPATSNVTISAPIGSEINIVDISGRAIAQYKIDNTTTINVNISNYNSGLYFVQVIHNGNSFTDKLLIK